MNIETAKQVLLKTHLAALETLAEQNYRSKLHASSYHLESGPGIGKSDGVVQYCEMLAAETGLPVGLIVFMAASIEAVDARGFMLPVKVQGTNVPDTVFSVPPWYPTTANVRVVMPDGRWFAEGEWTDVAPQIGVLFLDEFSQAEEDVQKAVSELIYKGAVGTTRLPYGWRVVSAGNRTSDKSGVVRQLKHIVNRRAKLSIEPNMGDWQTWAQRLDAAERPHHMTLSFARKNPHVVFKDGVPVEDEQYCTPRSLVRMDRDLMALRTDEDIAHNKVPNDDVAREVCVGFIGAGAAGQYFAHLKFGDEIPEITDIERDPMKAKLPSGKDGQMVAAFMVASAVTKGNSAKVMVYIGRMYVDMQTLCVSTILAQAGKAADVVQTKPFQDWLIRNKDILIASRS